MFARKSLIIFVINVFSKIIDALIFLFATKKYLVSEFGYLTIVASMFAIFSFFIDLNFSVTHVKKMSEKVYDDNDYFTTYMIIKIILIPVVSISMLVVIRVLFQAHYFENEVLSLQLIEIVFLTSILNSINIVYMSSFQARMKIAKMQFGAFIGHIVKLIFGIFVIFMMDGFIYYVMINLVLESSSLLVNLYYGKIFKFVKPRIDLLKSYFGFGIILLLMRANVIFLLNFGQLLFNNYFTDGQLGVYGVVTNLIVLLSILESAFQSLLLPNYAVSFKSGNLDKIRLDIEHYERYMLLIWGALLVLSCGLANYLLGLLGSEYQKEGLVLFLVNVLFTFNWGTYGAYSPIPIAVENSKILLLLSLIATAFSFFSWFFLIPVIGIVGIDMGRFLSSILNGLILRAITWKKYKIGNFKKKNAVLFCITIGISLVLLVIPDSIKANAIFMILLTAISLCAYLVLLFITKVISKQDVSFIFDTLNPKKLYKYIDSELREKTNI